MDILKGMRKRKNIAIVVALIVLLFIIFLIFREKESPRTIKESDEQEIIIKEQIDELEEIREERRQGKEFVPPTEDEIRKQLDELESLRKK